MVVPEFIADVGPPSSRLLFEPVDETTSSRSAERVREIVTGAWALSAEICQGCRGPRNPVTLGRGGRGTRCGNCRRARATGSSAVPHSAGTAKPGTRLPAASRTSSAHRTSPT